ncbi:MAG: rRNA pseudouridine synthase [Akkermansia sp.]|nr:rRNA pseudouridine synthase [Akkermansia sp.]
MTEENTYPPAPEGSVRLNKFLASCGYESRRAADRLIAEGRVEVNGKAVDTPGLRVLPTDFVKVDGRHATPKEEVVVLLNKPRGYVCSRDAQGAIGTVYDLLPAKYRYANYIGRLDADSEGLLLFTNNGVLSQSIGHPKGGIEKEYWVTLDQAFDSSVLIQLLKGVRIPEGQAKAKYVSRLSARRACVVLEQGLKRQVRQMFSCLGFRVKKLVRVRIGSLWGGDLEPGHATLLDAEQIAQATTNPRRRKGMLGAKQVFKPRTQNQQAATPADEDDDYVFNLADFETEEEALESSTKFTDGEAFEPERDNGRRPFGKAPRAKRDSFDNRNGGFGRERRSFGNREGGERRGGFGGGARKSFRSFNKRRPDHR